MDSESSKKTLKRLGVFIPTPPSEHGGGAERVMMRIAAGLAQRGHAVDFIVNRADSPCWAELSSCVRLIDLNVHRYACLPGLVKYIRAEQPDTLLSSAKSANLTSLTAKKFFTPRLRVVIHQANSLTGEYAIYGAKQRLGIRLLKMMMPAADGIVTLNRGMADDIRLEVPKAADRVRTIYDPHDIDDIEEKACRPVEHPWLSDNRDAPVVVATARLHFKKDFPTLLQAFALVVAERPARLIILGEGPELSNLTDLAGRLGIGEVVDFAGFKANPYPYMARADIFALSSEVEGLVGVLIEAMACGTPLVSTDCPFGPSEILDYGRLGRLSPVGDYKALAESIIDTLDNPTSREMLIEGARRFSAESSIAAYEKLCDLAE